MSPACGFSREGQSGEAAEAQGNTVCYTHRTRGSPGRPGREAGGRIQRQSRVFVGFPRARPGRAGITAQRWLVWVAPAWPALAHAAGPCCPALSPGMIQAEGSGCVGCTGQKEGGMAPDSLVCISKVCSHRGPLLSLKLAGPQRGSLSYARKDF